jgi:signal transduction histidine kinase
MTFPKAPIKQEKPPFLRGLRWKITIAFVSLFFCLLAVFGMIGAIIEHSILSRCFEQSAVSDEDLLLDWGLIQIDNPLTSDHKLLQKDSAELLPWLGNETKNPEAIKIWLKAYDEKLKLHRKTSFSFNYVFPTDSQIEQTSTIQLKSTDENGGTIHASPFRFIVFDAKANVVASSGFADSGDETFVDEKEFAAEVFSQNLSSKKEIDRRNGLHLTNAFPIFDEQNNLKGVLFFKDTLPFSLLGTIKSSLNDLWGQLASNIIFFTILGFVFGSPFASYLSKRLQNIASAAQSWRTGDFSAKTNDKSSDEIGILSRNLNEMADDLRENFALRQSIATAEERNRIARDLHDSVKQQVFGLAMQISTANALVEKNPESAKKYLHESENLIKEIQAELVDMIHEFSLPVNESQTFKVKIENFVSDWSRQNVMKTEIVIDEKLRVPSEIGQTFYRITQETLSNIARHSEATEVKISLTNSNKKLTMSFNDNGCGFDMAKTKKGFGLQSIRERAESLPKGWLKIDSKINGGTKVEVGCEI